MPLAILRSPSPHLEFSVTVEDESVALFVRRPTYQDLLRNDAFKLEEDWAGYHEWLAAHLVGWRGFTDEDEKELPFTPANAALAFGQLPQLYGALRDLVFGLYHRSKKDQDSGKAGSNGPSPATSAETDAAGPS